MQVSDTRKIHIMTFPHDILNACWSVDQSATKPRQPVADSAVGSTGWVNGHDMSLTPHAPGRHSQPCCRCTVLILRYPALEGSIGVEDP